MGMLLNTRCVEGIRTASHSYYQVIIINGKVFLATQLFVFTSTAINFVVLVIDLIAFSFTEMNIYTALLTQFLLVSVCTITMVRLKYNFEANTLCNTISLFLFIRNKL